VKRTSSLKRNAALRQTQLKKKGKQTNEYQRWKKEVAIPYLESHYPHCCARGCGETRLLDLGHIRARSTHPQLVMELTNVEWQCLFYNRFGACLK
jgi:hypothetical protein